MKNPERGLTESKGGPGGGKWQMLLKYTEAFTLPLTSPSSFSQKELGKLGSVAKSCRDTSRVCFGVKWAVKEDEESGRSLFY